MSLFGELKRRNVFRVGVAYVVASWLLIQVAETIFPLFGFDDTPARIVVIALAIGLIPALIFAWAFELTPEGLKKESEVDRSRSITPHTGKKLDRAIMVVLALALGYFAFDNFVLDPQREASLKEQQAEQLATATEQARQEGRSEALVESYGDKSIAVLAFDDMSPDGDQEYLSDGIAEELLNLLAKIPEMRVISRSSAFSYKGKDTKLKQIAEELNVAHILEGSVRKAGNRIRITAQLIEARSDTHLWSETYDRTLDDVFAIQDEIAATVVDQLKIKLLGSTPHVEEADPEAYALYLQARHLGRQGSSEGFNQSAVLYSQALAIQPEFAAAWNGLADTHISQAATGLLPLPVGIAKAREATERALAIDPNNARALAQLGEIAMVFEGDLTQAARHYERALDLEPGNLAILQDVATLLEALGRLDQAITIREYVTALDPLNPMGHAGMGISLIFARRWEDAVSSLRTALRLSPDYVGPHYYIGAARMFQGNIDAANSEILKEPSEVFRLIGLSMTQHGLGKIDAADAALNELITKYAQDAAYNIAYLLAYRNEADRAFEWLRRAQEQGDAGLSEIIWAIEFDPIRDDPRWPMFLESIGKAPDQLADIDFNVKLPRQ